jgi:hypothetical protein
MRHQIFVREYYGHLGMLSESPLATVYVVLRQLSQSSLQSCVMAD